MDRTERIHQPSRGRTDSGGPPIDSEAVIDLSVAPRRTTWQTQPAVDGVLGQEGPGPLAVAWRDRWLLLMIALVVGAATYGLSMQMAPVYSATTTMAFPYTGSDIALPGGDAERSRSLRTEAERITSLALLEQAADAIGGNLDARALRSHVTATPASKADVITIDATAATPSQAAQIADEVAAAYRRQVDQRQRRMVNDLKQQRIALEQRVSNLQQELAALLQDASADSEDEQAQVSSDPAVAATRLALEASVSQLSEVQVRLDQATAQHDSALGRIQILQPADPPAGPEQPRPARNAATMIVLALMTVGTIRWWQAEPDPPQVDSAQTVEAVLGAPIISEIPYVSRSSSVAGVVLDDYPQVVDAYRMVAAMSPVRGSILVTAARPDEACSDLVLNVGAVLNRDGYQVALVECDPQLGRLHPHRDGRDPGLTDFIAGHVRLQDVLHLGAGDEYANMQLVPWGSGHHGLPRGERSGLTYAIEELRAVADLVLIDGPPLASSADALNLAANVDGILVVVSIGTPLAELSRLRARLRQLDRPVLGVVVQHALAHRRPRRRGRRGTAPIRWRAPAGPASVGSSR
jgi:capsular polysaccharide biosynthesis protein